MRRSFKDGFDKPRPPADNAASVPQRDAPMSEARVLKPEEYTVDQEPYYAPVGAEVEVFEAA